MLLPDEMTSTSKQLLEELSFEEAEAEDLGMHKFYVWMNEIMMFTLINDRGYYDCYITPRRKPFERLELIKLLRFLKNDAAFLKEEQMAADLSDTLPSNDYIRLFYGHYELIRQFALSFSEETFKRYDNCYNILKD